DREKLTVVFYCDGMKRAEYVPSTGLWKTNSYGEPSAKIVEKCQKIMTATPSVGASDYDVIVRDGKVTVSEIAENE
ncbi:MAG: hypothetical protein LUD72_05235, partial [Bacteroidales bacterium]|nr:hypothetical protein [Bacteroidales bacterium]